MKKSLLILFAVLMGTAMILSSCKKDNDDKEGIVTDKIIGKWKVEKIEAFGMTMNPSAEGSDLTWYIKPDGNFEEVAEDKDGKTVNIGIWKHASNGYTFEYTRCDANPAMSGMKFTIEPKILNDTQLVFYWSVIGATYYMKRMS